VASVRIENDGGAIYRVIVEDAVGTSTHIVTVLPRDASRYAPSASIEELLTASFAFLLERESKESILSRFELPVIERYFPEYPDAMRRQFASRDAAHRR
jgi:hypothetical protein